MAAPANTFVSTAAIGNREDLTDVIYNIAPTETPFFNMAAKSKATATLHEWQTQDLAAAAANEQVEGDDAVANVTTPTVRLSNRTQISSKTAAVSGTQEDVDKAGRSSEMAYQMALKSAELKRDIEFGLCQNAVSATSPRRTRGLVGWVDSANVNAGAGYVAPNYVTNVAQTDGTQRAFTEALLKDVAQKVYTSGGNPNVVMMGPLAKQTFSTFTGNATRMDEAEDKKVTAAVDIYVSDFGTLKAVPNRFQRARDVFVLESEKWAVAWLRPIKSWELAKTGDSIRRQILGEYALEARNPKSGGAVVDIL
jgi:hypothetical protein